MIRYLLGYLVLFALAIPWYWSEDDQRLLFGLPIWVSVCIIVSILISSLTAYILLKHSWPDEQ